MRKRILMGAVLAVIGLVFALAGAQTPAGDDEQAVRKAGQGYSAAFSKGDLEELMSYWAPDADYVDETGKLHKGRDTITALVKSQLGSLKGYKLQAKVTSLRILKSEVALEDGTAELTAPDGTTSSSRFTAVWVKTNGKWLLSSVRDLPSEPAAAANTPYGRLKELEWLVGDWAHETKTVTVRLSCRWALGKSFLQSEYTVKNKDGEDMSVTQFFGWDPAQGKIRSWFFDSRGGYGEAYWTRQKQTWTAAAAGVLPDGKTGSATHSIRFLDDKNFVWQSAEREVDGEPLADAEVKFTRVSTGQ